VLFYNSLQVPLTGCKALGIFPALVCHFLGQAATLWSAGISGWRRKVLDVMQGTSRLAILPANVCRTLAG
ncbi:MAG TPA: hypothetical protein VGJ15_05015, partial [Pirellulales bacterium]